MEFSPRSVTVHEANVASVASFNYKVTRVDDESIVGNGNVPADPSGTTEISLQSVWNQELVGVEVRIYVQEVGPSGATADYQIAQHGDLTAFTVQEIPDGAESIDVNL